MWFSSCVIKLYGTWSVWMYMCCSSAFNEAMPCNAHVCICDVLPFFQAVLCHVCMYAYMLLSHIQSSCAMHWMYVYIYIHVLLSCGQLSHAVWLVYVCTHVVLLHLPELCCAICFWCVCAVRLPSTEPYHVMCVCMYICYSPAFDQAVLLDVCIVCTCAVLAHSIEPCHTMCVCKYMCCSPTFNQAVPCNAYCM